MDFGEQRINNKDMWEWQEADYYLKENPRSDISRCLWDEVNQSEDSLMYMLEEQTPIKDCSDFDYQEANFRDNINKQLEECRDYSQQKRRRMLHFPHDVSEIAIGSLRSSSATEREDEQINNGSPPVNVEWNSQYDIGLSGGTCAFNSEAWNQPSEGWLDNCLDQNVMQCGTDETAAPPVQDLNYDEVCNEPVNVSELYNLSADRETNMVLESRSSIRPKILKGCKNMMGTSTTLTTSVAYPFALIKPCGVEGDLTLKDINQKLHTPPPSRSKDMQDENSSLSYPTSAFSGKPVVVKTKIRTEGGKGSITIMRTKG